MWVIMNQSYFSVVKDRNKENHLLVRARVQGDIERLFPKVQVLSNAVTNISIEPQYLKRLSQK